MIKLHSLKMLKNVNNKKGIKCIVVPNWNYPLLHSFFWWLLTNLFTGIFPSLTCALNSGLCFRAKKIALTVLL